LQYYNPSQELEINQVCQNLRNDCDFVIAFVPTSEHPDYNAQVNPYKRIKRQLIERHIPSQMIDFDTLHDTIRKGWNEHIAYNLILGINAKLGYLNWKLTELPGTAQAFVGLDIGRKNSRSIGASAFVLDAQGQLIGWSTQDIVALQETFDIESLRNFLLDLISLYQTKYKQPLKHLVIHRDGKLQNSEYEVLVELKEYLKSQELEQLDVVELIKSGTCRAVEVREQDNQLIYKNPDKGYAWYYCPNEAIILTTGKREAKLDKSSPRPLRIRRRLGETDLMILAEQIYWLSEMQIGSTQSIRLPITTYYADRVAALVLEGLLPAQICREQHLWFL
jgi:argonaute-like protein implicated in RNA metabolism and viral defense